MMRGDPNSWKGRLCPWCCLEVSTEEPSRGGCKYLGIGLELLRGRGAPVEDGGSEEDPEGSEVGGRVVREGRLVLNGRPEDSLLT